MTLEDLGTIVAIIAGVALLLGVVAYGARGSILKATNEVLDKALQVERAERKETEQKCREEIATLTGRVATLTRDHARTVAHEVIGVFREEGVLPRRGGG